MKKIFLLLVIITFSSFSSNELKAQLEDLCPYPPYIIVDKVVTVGGCDFDVKICYNCGNWTSPNGMLKLAGYAKVNSNCIPKDEFGNPLSHNIILEEIYEIIYDFEYIKQELCDGYGPNIAPCDPPGNYTFINLFYYPCLYKFIYDNRVWYMPCMSVTPQPYCIYTLKLCWNGLEVIVVDTDVNESGNWDGLENCPIGPEAPDPVYPETESSCFRAYTPCRPNY